MAEVASNVKDVADQVTGVAKSGQPAADSVVEMVGGGESGQAFAKIAFKTKKI